MCYKDFHWEQYEFKTLDAKFAMHNVENSEINVVGLFERAWGRFYERSLIPLLVAVVGWVREINKDFEKLIECLTQEAAAGDDGMNISPFVNMDRKGGALQIMQQQFKQAIGVAIAKKNTNLDKWIMFVRVPRELLHACRAQHSGNN